MWHARVVVTDDALKVVDPNVVSGSIIDSGEPCGDVAHSHGLMAIDLLFTDRR